MVRHAALSCQNISGRRLYRHLLLRAAAPTGALPRERPSLPTSTRPGQPHALKSLLMLRGRARHTKSQGTAV
ncbi:hypothetical protein GAN18_27970 [Mycobacterium kubicae]|nr:hypothetical protein GAN18_27970 [Mycobacterium kubicae]